MIGVLVGAGAWAPGARAALDEEESHHLRVRRVPEGETVRFTDGAGTTGRARVHAGRGGYELEVLESGQAPAPDPLVLAVGAGDKDRFAWLVEKATEAGVTDVVPLETSRTAGVSTRVRASHVPKLDRRAREALKQCGGAWAPRVLPPVPFAAFVDAPRAGARWLLQEGGDWAPDALGAEPVTVLVGPEGGFSAEERGQAIEAGYRAVRVGPYTFRFETAAVAAAVLVHAARSRSAGA